MKEHKLKKIRIPRFLSLVDFSFESSSKGIIAFGIPTEVRQTVRDGAKAVFKGGEIARHSVFKEFPFSRFFYFFYFSSYKTLFSPAR